MPKEIIGKLIKIQNELKAPKGQFNKFGNYAYRSCEDILEAAKPLANKYGCALMLSDEVVCMDGRYYVKATAILMDDNDSVTNTAFAREAETKKGMDESQITGAASSYARKYALNGLFAIDDTKDNDSNELNTEIKKKQEAAPKTIKIELADKLAATFKSCDDEKKTKIRTLLTRYGYKNFHEILESDYQKMGAELKAILS